MTTDLTRLKKVKQAILLAEIGALLHDLGKLSKEFALSKGEGKDEEEALTEEGSSHFQHWNALRLHSLEKAPSFVKEFKESPLSSYDFVLHRFRSRNADWADQLSMQRQGLVDKICQRIEIRLKDARRRAVREATKRGSDREEIKQLIGEYQGVVLQKVERCIKEVKAGLAELITLDRRLEELKVIREVLLTGPDWKEAKAQCVHPLLGHYKRLRAEKAVPKDFIPSSLPTLLHDEMQVLLKGESIALSDYIELHHTRNWYVPYAVRLLRAHGGGTDGFDSWIDKSDADAQQDQERTLIATAFGHEVWRLPIGPDDEDGLKAARYEFARVLAEELCKVRDGQATPAQVRPHILKAAETAFRQALGETRRAANDVTLWDHSYSVASLYKAALAKVLLEGKWTEPKGIHWRLLRVGVDGLRFFAQAHHVTDILGRRRVLMDALDKVREVLEVSYPLGNEVYRDENGSVFVMPGLNDERHKPLAHEVEDLVREIFRQTGPGEELVPTVTWNKKPVRKEMITAFGHLITRELPPTTPDPQVMRNWWEEPQAKGQEICTVCGQRPVGYIEPGLEEWVTPQKAKDRNVCGVCLHRRGRRAYDWARNVQVDEEKLGPFERTIWTDEVADDNGRFALVVGRFVLDNWLDGRLVKTMLVAPGVPKNPSPARIRRCWETTRQFWREVQNDLIPEQVGERLRLGIRPANAETLRGVLGRWHTYEADVGGRRMGLCWDPDRDLFWTTDNLCYQGKQLGFKKKVLEDDDALKAAWVSQFNGYPLTLYEPGGYLGQDRQVNADTGVCMVDKSKHFRSFVPLLAEPSTFMALVPADKSLAVVQAVKAKYDTEMARVRDRLPLHLGLVFAPRRTPLAAVLEASRAMLKMPDGWQEWQIEALGRRASFSRDGQTFNWEYPAKMGDDKTDDVWYPHLLVRDPSDEQVEELDTDDFCRVDDPNLTGTVFIRPSRFDFEFLDTTARRFEIAYDEQGRRRGCPSRPYLLDELGDLRKLWDLINQRLTTSQWMALDGLIEQKRRAWDEPRGISGKYSNVFEQFVDDALGNAEWKQRPDEQEQTLLKRAALHGVLNDVINLYHEAMKKKED